MEARKELVCNDCGCRFEIREHKEGEVKTAKKEVNPPPPRTSCPECQSYNITTA